MILQGPQTQGTGTIPAAYVGFGAWGRKFLFERSKIIPEWHL